MNTVYASVIIPAYNEAKRITRTLESVAKYFRKRNIPHEIIVVDDGSKDDTVAIVKRLMRDIPSLRLLENGMNRGKGYSVNSGMRQAVGAYRVFMDADNSVDLSHMDEFLPWMGKGYDVVVGSILVDRAHITEHAGWHRRALGKVAKLLIGLLAPTGVEDTQRGFKVFSRTAAETVFPLQTIERWGFDIEILVIARLYGFRVKELPVSWNNPDGSKVGALSYLQTFRELLKIIFNRITGKYAPRLKNAVVIGSTEVSDVSNYIS